MISHKKRKKSPSWLTELKKTGIAPVVNSLKTAGDGNAGQSLWLLSQTVDEAIKDYGSGNYHIVYSENFTEIIVVPITLFVLLLNENGNELNAS